MQNPFDLDNTAAYLRWRDHKLAHAITDTNELIVGINDPRSLPKAEHAALLERWQRSSMVIYATAAEPADEDMVRQFGLQFGLDSLDANWLAGEQGITRVTVCADDGQRQAYTPYTDRAIKWHTDGYYNPPERQVRGMILHCVQSAGQGGENRLMDHEIVYLMLRDENSDHASHPCQVVADDMGGRVWWRTRVFEDVCEDAPQEDRKQPRAAEIHFDRALGGIPLLRPVGERA